jgi:hypothetical protein
VDSNDSGGGGGGMKRVSRKGKERSLMIRMMTSGGDNAAGAAAAVLVLLVDITITTHCWIPLFLLIWNVEFGLAADFLDPSRVEYIGKRSKLCLDTTTIDCHTQFCLAGIMIPLRQSYCD